MLLLVARAACRAMRGDVDDGPRSANSINVTLGNSALVIDHTHTVVYRAEVTYVASVVQTADGSNAPIFTLVPSRIPRYIPTLLKIKYVVPYSPDSPAGVAPRPEATPPLKTIIFEPWALAFCGIVLMLMVTSAFAMRSGGQPEFVPENQGAGGPDRGGGDTESGSLRSNPLLDFGDAAPYTTNQQLRAVRV